MEKLNLDDDYFKYLLYCHQLSESDGAEILSRLESDLEEGKANEFNMIEKLEDYCNHQIITNEKEQKIAYLYTIIDSDDYFITQTVSRYGLSNDDIIEIAEKIEREILDDNIAEYTIKRNFKCHASDLYFLRKNKRQLAQIENNLERHLKINRKISQLKNVTCEDVRTIIDAIYRDLDSGRHYSKSMLETVISEMEILSKSKKLEANRELQIIVEKKPEYYNSVVRRYDLNQSQSDMLLNQMTRMIEEGELERCNVRWKLIQTAEEIMEAGK